MFSTWSVTIKNLGVVVKKILCICLAVLALANFAYAAQVNQVAAVVNGRMISVFDVKLMADAELARTGLNRKGANSAQLQDIYKKTLDDLIVELLIVDAAEKQKITVSSAEVDAEIARIMQQSGATKATFEKRLQKDGMTISAFQNRIRNSILRQKLMGSMVGRKIIVTPDEVRNYYEANKEKFKSKDETVLALLVYPDGINPTGYAAQIAKNSSRFEEVARQVSVGPNKENGGSLGPVDMKKMPAQLAALINKLPTGGVTPIIRLNGKNSQFKKLKANQGGRQMTFEEAKPAVESIVREPRLKARFEQYIQELRSKAVIDIRM